MAPSFNNPHAVLLAAAVSVPALATAQQEPVRVQVDGYDPASPRSNVLGVETSDVPDHLEPTMHAAVRRTDSSLRLRIDDELRPIVDDRWTVGLGLGLGLADDFLVDAQLELVAFQTGTSLTSDSAATPAFAAGDARFRAKWRILRRSHDRPFGLGFQAAVWAPTGGAGYASDGAVRVEPRLDLDVEVGPMLAVANLGYQIRPRRELTGYTHDDVIRWGLGGRLPIAAGFRVDASLLGSHSPFRGPGDEANRFAHPIEVLAGVGWRSDVDGPMPGMDVSLAAGAGLTRSVGSPAHRLLLTVGYSPGASARGRHAEEPEPREYVHCRSGDVVGPDQDCPPTDRDGDAVADADDVCPDVPGSTDDASRPGCPVVDRLDACSDGADGCPTEPAVAEEAASPECDYCGPDETMDVVTGAIFFGTDSADFLPQRHPLLLGLRDVAELDESIVRIVVEGHTDAKGPAKYNLQLSRERANSVRDRLISAGVDPDRVEVYARGESQPLADNDTESGRSQNRRVEFRIVRRKVVKREPPPPPRDLPPELPEERPLEATRFAYDRRLDQSADDRPYLENAAVQTGDRRRSPSGGAPPSPRVRADAAARHVVVQPPPPRVHRLEVGVASAILVSARRLDRPEESAISTIPSARFTARLLFDEWLSVGLIGDVGAQFGDGFTLFTPGLGVAASLHVPLGAVRPFVTAGAEAWFPGFRTARPGFEGAVGADWEPVERSGVRASFRTAVLAGDGEPLVLPGGSLGVYTTF